MSMMKDVKNKTREKVLKIKDHFQHLVNHKKVANQCLSCHARDRTAETQAPMISVTHFMDRDGNFLADVSPRRYFCSQCHVTQIERQPLLENTFKDVKELTSTKTPKH